MRRILGAVPWLLLTVAVGVAGWIAVDLARSVRAANEEPVAVETTTTVTTTTTSTTSTVPSTTNTEPPATSTTTTTTTQPEATTTTLPGFYWGDHNPAPLGYLTESVDTDPFTPGEAYVHGVLSGVLLEGEQREVTIPWEGNYVTTEGEIARFDLGRHPQTGQPVVGEFLVSMTEVGGFSLLVCNLRTRWLLQDDDVPGDVIDPGYTCLFPSEGALALNMGGAFQVGRQYAIEVAYLIAGADIRCELYPQGDQDSCRQERDLSLLMGEYARELVAALRGEGTVPDGFGLVSVIYLFPAVAQPGQPTRNGAPVALGLYTVGDSDRYPGERDVTGRVVGLREAVVEDFQGRAETVTFIDLEVGAYADGSPLVVSFMLGRSGTDAVSEVRRYYGDLGPGVRQTSESAVALAELLAELEEALAAGAQIGLAIPTVPLATAVDLASCRQEVDAVNGPGRLLCSLTVKGSEQIGVNDLLADLLLGLAMQESVQPGEGLPDGAYAFANAVHFFLPADS